MTADNTRLCANCGHEQGPTLWCRHRWAVAPDYMILRSCTCPAFVEQGDD